MTEVAHFRSAVVASAANGTLDPAVAEFASAVRVAVLVEGESDRVAIETLATRLGRDLDADGVCAIPMGGVTSVNRFLDVLVPTGLQLAGLYDASEQRYIERGLERAGLARVGLEQLGFFACERDLEDELIRACGVDHVERIIEAEGDLRALRSLQNQPFQRSWTREQVLLRFMSSIGGRKARYALALVEALDLDEVPRPLRLLLEYLNPPAR